MIVKGTVYKINGNYAQIKTPRPQSCESCSNYSLCKGRDVDMRVLNPVNAALGDTVEVEVSEDAKVMWLMAYIFMTPVAILFVSYFFYTLSPLLALLAVPLCAGYFLILRKLNRTFRLRSQITRIMRPEESLCAKDEEKE